MDVTIETSDGRRFDEEFWFFASVPEMKRQLQKNHGFSISRQTLLFDGKTMEDERDLEYYRVLQGSRIFLDLAPEPEAEAEPEPDPPNPTDGGGEKKVKVTVLLPRAGPGMRRVEAEVNLADNVSQLRLQVLRMRERVADFYLPEEGFFFICKQNVMEEDRPFRWHDVKDGDVIEVFNGSVTAVL